MTAARLAASGRCWLCGAPCEGERCTDPAECFARSVAPPGAPAAEHPTGTGACDPDEPACCDECAAAYAEPDARDEESEEITR